jgi:hypothetical protein
MKLLSRVPPAPAASPVPRSVHASRLRPCKALPDNDRADELTDERLRADWELLTSWVVVMETGSPTRSRGHSS